MAESEEDALQCEADALLAELTAEEIAAALPAPPPSFPCAPVSSLTAASGGKPSTAKDDETHCSICGRTAHVWCSDCSDQPYCAKCWREVHVGISGGLRADPALRAHKTVPCRAIRLENAMPSAPTRPPAAGGAPAAKPTPSAATPRAPSRLAAEPSRPKVPCQTCDGPAFVCCVDCDRSNYCLKCWREIHVFPKSDIIRHRREQIPLSVRS